MSFAAGLSHALQLRRTDVAAELSRGDSLEEILNRHLLAVEEMSDTEILTSILLLSEDGKSLRHGAAPSLPQAYMGAIDGAAIGPSAGSCGTAAYLGRPVYVSDIATDMLWADYRDLALPHGLRSCWSTPIRNGEGQILGTFAIYHRNLSRPTRDELDAIDIITDNVAQAITCSRDRELGPGGPGQGGSPVTSSAQNGPRMDPTMDMLPRQVAALEALATAISQHASSLDLHGREAIELVLLNSAKLSQAVERRMVADPAQHQ